MIGCTKKYTDPSSLRKHVKNHSFEEQKELKNRTSAENSLGFTRKYKKIETYQQQQDGKVFYELPWQVHQITSSSSSSSCSGNIKQDLKNKISEKNRQRKFFC